MKKTNLPAADVYTFTNRFGEEVTFKFEDIIPLDVVLLHTEIFSADIANVSGVLILPTNDEVMPHLAFPVQVNMEGAELLSVDIIEYDN